MMDQVGVASILGLLGATYMLTGWIGRLTGDADRDIRLMTGLGLSLLAVAAAVLMS